MCLFLGDIPSCEQANKHVCRVCLCPFKQNPAPLLLFIPDGSLAILSGCGSGVTGLLKCWSLGDAVDERQVALGGLIPSYLDASDLFLQSIATGSSKVKLCKEVLKAALHVSLFSNVKE